MVRIRKLVENYMERHTTFLVFGFCGLAGILVDFDHAVSLLLHWYHNPEVSEGRIFHTSLLIISCLAICYLVSRIPGLYSKLVLVAIGASTLLVLLVSPWVVWSWISK